MMNIRTKTYRLFSALTLMLFISSVVLPGAVSAASLLCDMPMAEMHQSQHSCCDQSMVEDLKTNHHRSNSDNDHCNSEQICLHSLSPEKSDVQALVISHSNTHTLLVESGETLTNFDHTSQFRVQNSTFNIPNNPPPLFLLNSTFLN